MQQPQEHAADTDTADPASEVDDWTKTSDEGDKAVDEACQPEEKEQATNNENGEADDAVDEACQQASNAPCNAPCNAP